MRFPLRGGTGQGPEGLTGEVDDTAGQFRTVGGAPVRCVGRRRRVLGQVGGSSRPDRLRDPVRVRRLRGPGGGVDRPVEGHHRPRLQHRVRVGLQLAQPPLGLPLLGVLGRAEGLAALLGGGAGLLLGAGAGAHPPPPRRDDALRGRRHVDHDGVLRLGHALLGRQPVRPPAVHAGRRPRPQPAAAEPGDDDPSPDALPRLHLASRSRSPSRWRRCSPSASTPAGSTPSASGPSCSWLFLSVGIMLGMWWAYVELGWGGYWAWDPVENATLPAVAHHDGVPALGDDPGEARHAQALEPDAHHRDVPAQHLRHLHHALGRHRERAQLHPVERRLLLPRLPVRDGGGGLHAALHPLAAARGRRASSSRW